MKTEPYLPKGWILYPLKMMLNGFSPVEFGINMPAPYIWFFYWLITRDEGKIEISFMPD